MAYTTINKHTAHFNTKLYTGNGADNNAITGVGFQPDMVWLKNRSTTDSHYLQDAVRTATKNLKVDATDAEETRADSLKSFNSDGFTLGTESAINGNGNNLASWNWKANGAGSANNDGSIATTVSANTTAGFSIVKYDSTNTNGSTFGHGLGVNPDTIIFKNLDSTEVWLVYHKGIGTSKYLFLSGNDAEGSSSNWISVSNTTFTMNNTFASGNNGDNFIAYCFAEKKGYSKFGSYTGNGNADGTFVFTGFKPAVLIIKRTDTTKNWYMHDIKRDGYNADNSYLSPNLTAADTGGTELDLLSNGFKMRSSGTGHNENNGTYIYMAFGQTIVGTNNVPTTAR